MEKGIWVLGYFKKRKRKKGRKYTHTDNSITKVNFQRNEHCKSMRKKMSFSTEKRTSGISWIFTFQDLIFFGKWCGQQGNNLQKLQSSSTSKQTNKQNSLIKIWTEYLNRAFFQRRYIGGQKAHETMLNIVNQRNTNQNHNEASPHTCQNGRPQSLWRINTSYLL